MALTERLNILIDADGGKAVREFSLVGKSATSEMGKVEKASGGLTGALKNAGEMAKVGLAAGLSVGAAALVSFASDAINAASDLGEQQSATNTIFGKGARIVSDFSKSAATSLGVSQRAALEASNGFGDLFLNVGFTEKQAANLSIAMVQLAGDLASFKNLGTDVVLEKLRSGLTGETEPLRALGIVINDAAVKSKAMELGLGGAHRELTEGEKIAARYALIVEKSSRAQGDVARTADSLANRQRILNAQLEDSKAAVGQYLAPALSTLFGKASTALGVVDKLSGSSSAGGISKLTDTAINATPGFGPLNRVLGLFQDEAKGSATTAALLEQAEKDLGLATGALAEFTKDEGKAQLIAAEAAERHARAIDRQNRAMIDILGASLGYEKSLNSLEDSQVDVAEAQKALTDAVKDHGRNSPEARAAAEALSRAQLDLRQNVLDAARAFEGQAQQQAIAAGKEWDAVDAARAQIAGLEDMKKKYPELRAEIDAYIAKLLSIPGVVDTRVSLETGAVQPADKSGHRVKRYATGGMVDGPVGAPQLAIVHGGERVLTPAQQRMASTGAAGVTTITINMPPGSNGDDVVNAIQRYERRNGKGWRSA